MPHRTTRFSATHVEGSRTGMAVTRRKGRLGLALTRIVAAVLSVLAFSGTLFMSNAGQQAQALPDIACYMSSDVYGRGPESPDTGVEAFFAPKSPYGANPDNSTVFEQQGVRGATWSGTEWLQQDGTAEVNGDEDEKVCSPINEVMTTMAQMIFNVDRTITSSVIALRQRATDPTVFLEVIRDMVPTTNTLREKVFIPGATIMVILTGFWVFGKIRNNQTRAITSGLVWMGGATVFTAFMLLPAGSNYIGTDNGAQPGDPNYMWITYEASDLSNDAQTFITNAVTQKTSSADPVCGLPAGAPNRGVRSLDCTIYKTLVFDPWVLGQFGNNVTSSDEEDPNGIKDVNPALHPIPVRADLSDEGPRERCTEETNCVDTHIPIGTDLRVFQLQQQAITKRNLKEGYFLGNPDGSAADFSWINKYGRWNQLRLYMWEDYNQSYRNWKGDEPMVRMGQAFAGLIASILVGLFVAVTSLLTMLWNAVPVVLLLMLPFVGLVAIHPAGQKALRTWLQTFAKAFILVFVFGTAQVISLFMVSGVMSSTIALGWKCILMTVLVWALWKVVQAARQDALTPNLGGDVQMAGAPDQVFGRAVGASKTAAAPVARGGKRAGGRVARSAGGATTGAARGAVSRTRGAVSARRAETHRQQGVFTSDAIEQRRQKVRAQTGDPNAELTRAEEKQAKQVGNQQFKQARAAKRDAEAGITSDTPEDEAQKMRKKDRRRRTRQAMGDTIRDAGTGAAGGAVTGAKAGGARPSATTGQKPGVWRAGSRAAEDQAEKGRSASRSRSERRTARGSQRYEESRRTQSSPDSKNPIADYNQGPKESRRRVEEAARKERSQKQQEQEQRRSERQAERSGTSGRPPSSGSSSSPSRTPSSRSRRTRRPRR